MQDLDEKRVIEAALFMSAQELTLEQLKILTGVGAIGYLQGKINELKKEYEERGSALEILEENGKYSMRIRNDYVGRVKQFAQDSEVSKAALRTLAYISKHDGVLKSELVKKIGTQAYQDVKELVENGFVKTHKAGRTSKVVLTDKFRRYFSGTAAAAVPKKNENEDISQTTLTPAIPEPPKEEEFSEEEKME